jgi:hypothetical protein
MVEAAIIMVDNVQKALEHFHDENGRDPDSRERSEAIIRAAQGVGRPLFLLLLVITVSFVPASRSKRRRGASRRNGIRFRVRVFREETADPADPLNYVISPSALG